MEIADSLDMSQNMSEQEQIMSFFEQFKRNVHTPYFMSTFFSIYEQIKDIIMLHFKLVPLWYVFTNLGMENISSADISTPPASFSHAPMS